MTRLMIEIVMPAGFVLFIAHRTGLVLALVIVGVLITAVVLGLVVTAAKRRMGR